MIDTAVGAMHRCHVFGGAFRETSACVVAVSVTFTYTYRRTTHHLATNEKPKDDTRTNRPRGLAVVVASSRRCGRSLPVPSSAFPLGFLANGHAPVNRHRNSEYLHSFPVTDGFVLPTIFQDAESLGKGKIKKNECVPRACLAARSVVVCMSENRQAHVI